MQRVLSHVLTVLFVGAAAFSAYSQDDDVISVDSSVVIMNAAITDASGKAVRGLTQNNFEVFENKRPQEISFFSSEDTPFAAVILIDASGSMEGRLALARSAAIKFLEGLRVDDNVAIYKFDHRVELVQDFSNSRDIGETIYNVKAYGMTVLNDAVYKAAEVLSHRPEKRRAIIVLSDGLDTQSRRSTDAALKAASAANATIYTVDMSSPDNRGIAKNQIQGQLKKMSEKTGGIFVATPGGQAMRDAFERIVEELGVLYTIGFASDNEKKDGKWRELELRINRPNLTIRTRKGYNAAKK